MACLEGKQADKQLVVFNALQRAHLIERNPLSNKHDFNDIVENSSYHHQIKCLKMSSVWMQNKY